MIGISRNLGFTPIVGKVPPRTGGSSIPVLNSYIESAVNNANPPAPLVDQYSVFGDCPNSCQSLMVYEQFTTGGAGYLHPSREGYQQMAQKWFDAQLQYIVEKKRPVTSGAALLLLLDEETPP
jgi:hypothetical protein